MNKLKQFFLLIPLVLCVFPVQLRAQETDIFTRNIHSAIRFGVGFDIDPSTLRIGSNLDVTSNSGSSKPDNPIVPNSCRNEGLTGLYSRNGREGGAVRSLVDLSNSTFAFALSGVTEVSVRCGSSRFETLLYLEFRVDGEWTIVELPSSNVIYEIFAFWSDFTFNREEERFFQNPGENAAYFRLGNDERTFAIRFDKGRAIIGVLDLPKQVADRLATLVVSKGYEASVTSSAEGTYQLLAYLHDVEPFRLIDSYKTIGTKALDFVDWKGEIEMQLLADN